MNEPFYFSAGSVFDVWATYDRCYGRVHYPSYRVKDVKVGSALELRNAERIVREVAEDSAGRYKLHSLRVIEVPLGKYAHEWDSLSERVYSREGKLLDRRTYPPEIDLFGGRPEEELRFKRGDLCEVLDGERIYLGFVVDVPPTAEEVSRRNANCLYPLDASDGCYRVQTEARGSLYDHVDSLHIFTPQHKISSRTENRLRNAYQDYLTFPKRMQIADTTAKARLQAIFEELGWTAEIVAPSYEDDTFLLKITGVPSFPNGLGMEIAQRKAWGHMDQIRNGFLRLAGRPAQGRGYRLKLSFPSLVDQNGKPLLDMDYPFYF